MNDSNQLMTLFQAQSVLTGAVSGGDVGFSSVSIDTRTLQPGALFVALKGPHFNGHDYVLAAKQAGAAAVLVERFQSVDLPQLQVNNTMEGLTELARWNRQRYTPTTIAVTGSCGKTTTRALLDSIFSQKDSVLATQGNYNNHLGVPLMLLQLRSHHRFLILELGADSVGEIAHLTSMVQPHVGLVTLAARAHIETFGSIEGVAQGKGELFAGLPEDGLAVMNRDDRFFEYWCGLLGSQECMTFGMDSAADVWASDIRVGEGAMVSFLLHCFDEMPVKVCLPLLGDYNVTNAVAAAAVALATGIDLPAIVNGLENAQAVAARMVRHSGLNGATIVDDTYNANPCSVNAAINTLASFSGKRILVLGDMLELGDRSQQWHNEVGLHATDQGVDVLFGLGELTAEATRAFGPDAVHFSDHDSLIQALKKELDKDTVVMVKGSNSLNMNSIVTAVTMQSPQ